MCRQLLLFRLDGACCGQLANRFVTSLRFLQAPFCQKPETTTEMLSIPTDPRDKRLYRFLWKIICSSSLSRVSFVPGTQ